ncbi:MAG TPA: 5'-methylthioadenosine/S-adenosylhomocysteine nucleosidase [Candidatus Brocadiia bacterium]|nr:5'-methylthioadenosine/S-adenosylhomocysteine nucleosidase [Candidatus Brocadiales bacterium]
MIAIVCAMSSEVEPIKAQMNVLKTFSEESATFYQAEFNGFPITIVQSGIGMSKAVTVTKRLLQLFKIHLIISAGFAGGLQERINVGDLIIAKNVLYAKHTCIERPAGATRRVAPTSEGLKVISNLPCESSFVRLARDIGNEEGLKIHVGDIITVDEMIAQSKTKMSLGENLSALAVDMETAFIGQVASDAGIPFVSVRSISDDVNDDIVVDFKHFVDDAGNVKFRSVVSQISKVLPHIVQLRQMHKQAKIAATTLAAFLPHFITSLYNQIVF